MNTDYIPLVDLKSQHAEVSEELQEDLDRVLTSASFVGGPDVAAFEAEYAAFTGVAHCVGVANGTDAVELALRAVGVGVGDEVIIPANTFIATAEAVARIGARPVLVDVQADSLMIDVERVADAVTPRTRAVVPVHLFGRVAETSVSRSCCGGLEWRSWRTRRSPRGRLEEDVVLGPSGPLARPASTPARTSVLPGMPVRSRPTTPRSRAGCAS